MKKNSIADQIRSLKHGQQLLASAILFFILVVLWIFVGIFAGQQESKISPALKKAALPLTPNIDEDIITELEEKRVYTQDELANFTIYKIITTDRGKEQSIVPITVFSEDLEEQTATKASLNDIIAPESTSDASESAETEVTTSPTLPN